MTYYEKHAEIYKNANKQTKRELKKNLLAAHAKNVERGDEEQMNFTARFVAQIALIDAGLI